MLGMRQRVGQIVVKVGKMCGFGLVEIALVIMLSCLFCK